MELVIVCLLAGIFLTVSIPTLRNSLVDDAMDSSARKLIGAVKEVRNTAVREHKPYLIHFDLERNRLWYELQGSTHVFDSEPESGAELQLPEEVRFAAVRPASQGTDTSSSEVVVWVSSRGYMDRTVVQLSGSGNRELTLVFSPFAASAEVYDGHVAVD